MDKLLAIILDPKVFNYLILFLYLSNSIRWALEKNTGQIVYWCGAFIITFAVTFLMEK